MQATDGNGNRGMKPVKVTVENENEDGVVTLSKTQPRVGIAVTASLTDPDGSISGLHLAVEYRLVLPGRTARTARTQHLTATSQTPTRTPIPRRRGMWAAP